VGIAFFDLDKTLLAQNSATLWVRYALRHGTLRHRDALQAMVWLMRYHFGASGLDVPMRRSIASLAGQREATMRAQVAHFFATEVRHLYRRGGLRALAHHRLLGDTLVLLTSSTNYLAEAVSAELHLEAPLCTRLEVDRLGYFTGRPIEPLSFGDGKLALAKAFAAERRVDLAACTFYSDSAADLPVFHAVGRPVAINPDPSLRRRARQAGWPVVDWGPPPGADRKLVRTTLT
jgi:HAD superfamily hydrolase (TIGR01490 family)